MLNPLIQCDWVFTESVNYVMQQNHVPIVRSIILTNVTEEHIQEVTVTITAEPQFAYKWTQIYDVLPAGQAIDLGEIRVLMSSSFLSELSEKLTGTLKLSVSQGETVLYEESGSIMLLEFEEWNGLTVLPEMIASFVTPNHPQVLQLVQEAADVLGQGNEGGSFNAYQSKDPNQVRMQVAAIYETLRAKNITYGVAPHSLEEMGQHVRLADEILANLVGNCLDLSLLYAACMEAVGLHPLLVFTEGHVFVGVWLVENTFAESVQDDISLLTKRIEPGNNEICVIEAMACTDNETFEDAELLGGMHLTEQSKFDCVVDIHRARSEKIVPLPPRVATTEGWEMESTLSGIVSDTTSTPVLIDVIDKMVDAETTSLTKQKVWERSLLDLSLRNTLINFRITQSSVPLMTMQLEELEEGLASQNEFQVMAKPEEWQDEINSTELYQSISSHQPLAALLREEFDQKRLRVDITPDELERRLVHLYRSARSSLEENGANTLYVALGLLKWYESPDSELQRYAPLLLIPVDIVRASSGQGYYIRGRDEDAHINITLLEMLRQDLDIYIGGLEVLPRNERGLDLQQIFTVFRQELLQVPRWDIEETAYLGLFSFGQFVMWNDIRNREVELAENPIVSSLMNGKLGSVEATIEENEEMIEAHQPTNLTIPISADSMQLEAITAVSKGRSIVLNGPPGTGKSQTITNIIANAMAEGKRVLFVAEKRAALSVVQTRLANIGLGAFCLELHSNKSTKKAVLDQLSRAIDIPLEHSPEDWNIEADRLEKLRTELDGYVNALHHKYHFGFSLYEAISGYERAEQGPDTVQFAAEMMEHLNPELITTWRDLVSQLEVAGAACGGQINHPLREIRLTSYSPTERADIEKWIKPYGTTLLKAGQTQHKASKLLRLDVPGGYEGTAIFASICELMLNVPDFKPAVFQSISMRDTVFKLLAAAEQAKHRGEIRNKVCSTFKPEIFEYKAGLRLTEWMATEEKWILPKWFGQMRIYKKLKAMTLPGQTLSKNAVKTYLIDIMSWQEEERKLQEIKSFAETHLGESLWNEESIQWDEITVACEWVTRLYEQILALYDGTLETVPALARIGDLLVEGNTAFATAHSEMITEAIVSYQEAHHHEEQLGSLLQLNMKRLSEAAQKVNWHVFMYEKVGIWQQNLDALKDWSAWRRVRDAASTAGLRPLIVPYEQGLLHSEQIAAAFERGLYKACANYIMGQDVLLRFFSGGLFEERIKLFTESDLKFHELSKQEILARLTARVATMSEDETINAQMLIFQHALRSGASSVSIRKLFDQIPNLLARLTPCMLMSPSSVAQYLNPECDKFDLVIFDEASQVSTARAIGVLARGKQAVIVGDPKQLPPTNFFSRVNQVEDEDVQDIEELESILDDCLAIGMPQFHLSWHYRSHHESLIAFSNAHYYDNKLMTFPSPNEQISSVRWCHVEDGFYDRGRSRQNEGEGKAIVAEVIRRLRDPQLRQQSIGVVTFSSTQQALIEDLLDEAFLREPELDMLMSELNEPLFIKNLENVQGDERDVILFSIGYGPDEEGKVSLNFGALNREGGWRRLNVAVSRARREMMVFSTLRSEQLSASRTNSQGVLGLKKFLEYAERGSLALTSGEFSKEISLVSDINDGIVAGLKKRGYESELLVGASGYRVDVAIKDPSQPDKYLLGVLLDGPIYCNAKTARDRDVLRSQMMEQLGWNIHQVWTPDWWENAEAELSKLEQAIQQASERKISLNEVSANTDAQQILSTIEREELVDKELVENIESSIEAVEEVETKEEEVAAIEEAEIEEVVEVETIEEAETKEEEVAAIEEVEIEDEVEVETIEEAETKEEEVAAIEEAEIEEVVEVETIEEAETKEEEVAAIEDVEIEEEVEVETIEEAETEEEEEEEEVAAIEEAEIEEVVEVETIEEAETKEEEVAAIEDVEIEEEVEVETIEEAETEEVEVAAIEDMEIEEEVEVETTEEAETEEEEEVAAVEEVEIEEEIEVETILEVETEEEEEEEVAAIEEVEIEEEVEVETIEEAETEEEEEVAAIEEVEIEEEGEVETIEEAETEEVEEVAAIEEVEIEEEVEVETIEEAETEEVEEVAAVEEVEIEEEIEVETIEEVETEEEEEVAAVEEVEIEEEVEVETIEEAETEEEEEVAAIEEVEIEEEVEVETIEEAETEEVEEVAAIEEVEIEEEVEVETIEEAETEEVEEVAAIEEVEIEEEVEVETIEEAETEEVEEVAAVEEVETEEEVEVETIEEAETEEEEVAAIEEVETEEEVEVETIEEAETEEEEVAATIEITAKSSTQSSTKSKGGSSRDKFKYKVATLDKVNLRTEAFYTAKCTELILDQIKQTIQQEGPISRNLLTKRVLQAWEISRSGPKMERRLTELLSQISVCTTEEDGVVFFWPDRIQPEHYAVYRPMPKGEDRRSAEDLPREEIANAIKSVLSTHRRISEEDLIKRVSKIFSYPRSGTAIEQAIRNGLDYAILRDYVVIGEQSEVIFNG